MKLWFVVCCLFLSLSVMGQGKVFPAGEYIAEGGWGTLRIEPAKQGKQSFELYSLGANGHMCHLEGDVHNNLAVLETAYDYGSCKVQFKPKGNAIDVDNDLTDACRYFCGARAGFSGVYQKPAIGCDQKSIQNTRAAFLKLYKNKDYAAAERTLAPILKNCQKTLFWLEDGDIRNDLALTQAKLGKGAACTQTLKPLAEDAALSDSAVCNRDGRSLPPTDCDSYLPIVQAARTNLKWCAKAKK